MSKGLKISLILGISFFALYTVGGFWGIPWAITTQLPSRLSEQLGRQVVIQEARFNPFVFTLQINRFNIQEKDHSPLVGFDELFMDFEPLVSLFTGTYTFSDIRLGLPYGLAVVRADGGLNLTDLQPSPDPQENNGIPPDAEAPLPDSRKLPPVFIANLSIQQGVVEFQDLSRPTPFVAHIVPINLTLENFSTQKGQESPYSLSAGLSEGEKIRWEGSVVLEPFRAEGSLALENIQLPALWGYLQDQFRFDLPQGLANLNGRYQISTEPEGVQVRVNQGNLIVQDLQFREKGAARSVIAIPLVEMTNVGVDVTKQNVFIPSVNGKDAHFTAWIEPNGVMNYQRLFTPIVEIQEPDPAQRSSPDADAAPSWNMVIQDLKLENFAVDFEDRQPEVPVRLLFQNLDFHTSDVALDFVKPLPIDLGFQFNETGKARFQGTVEIAPLVVDLDLSLSDIGLRPFQPYLAPYVQFTVGGGALGLQGHTHFQKRSSDEPRMTFQGEMAVAGLVLEDPAQSTSFLKWENVIVKSLDLQIEPTEVNMGTVTLVNPALFMSREAEGGMNLKRLLAPSESQKRKFVQEPLPDETSSGQPATPVKIGTVDIQNLLARFSDASVAPHVVTQIDELTGTIQGLSSDQIAKADIRLEGKVDGHSPFRIAGQINPLSGNAYTDVTVALTNFELPTVSSYSAAYTGYPIQKGKVSLDLAYKISERTLVAENTMVIDQMQVGKKVESPDAASLPIPLALALLRDRKGQIDISLPVRGHLNDPDFNYRGVIWCALVNLLTKIATSPFSMLGGLLEGSPDDLQFVAFPAGEAQLSPAEQEKLTALGKGLQKRPGLGLDITGAADSVIDRPALARAQLRAQLQKRKFDREPAAAQKGLIVENIELSNEEEAQLISELYVETFGSLPKGASPSPHGKPSAPPATDDVKAELLASMPIEEPKLHLLAQQRAQHIRDYLVQKAQVSGERIFIVESTLSPVTEGNTIQNPLALTAN